MRGIGDLFEKIADFDMRKVFVKAFKGLKFWSAVGAFIFQMYAAVRAFPDKATKSLVNWALAFATIAFFFTLVATFMVRRMERVCCRTLKDFVDVLISASALSIAVVRKVHHAWPTNEIVSICTSMSTVLAALSTAVVYYRGWRTKKAFVYLGGHEYVLTNNRRVGILGNATEQDAEMISDSNPLPITYPSILPVMPRKPPLPIRAHPHNL